MPGPQIRSLYGTLALSGLVNFNESQAHMVTFPQSKAIQQTLIYLRVLACIYGYFSNLEDQKIILKRKEKRRAFWRHNLWPNIFFGVVDIDIVQP